MRYLFTICLSIFLSVSCNAQNRPVKFVSNKDNNTLLWEVSGKGLKKASYLFGTFHLLCKDDIHFSDPLKAAVANVDNIYMELDMDDPSMILGAILLMNMREGKKLRDLYSDTDYIKLEKYFKDSLHTDLTLMQSLKPYFLMALLYPKMMPCKMVTGIEEELMQLAKQQKKEIKGLETLEFQVSVFDSIPYEEQANELLRAIDSMETYRKYFDTMVYVYKMQQVNEIEKLFSKSEFGMKEHQDILLDNRNKNWAKQLSVIMEKENAFVAVGAGHLVGESGLVVLLRKEGYVVRPILNR